MQEFRLLSSAFFGTRSDDQNRQKNGPLWHFEYPVVRNEVNNSAIARFQSGIVNLAEASERNSVVDFTRSYYLRGKNYPASTEPEVVLSGIYQFVDSATGYGNSPLEKAKLKEYMATRGGQNHNFLLQDLIQANHFLNNSVRGQSSVFQNFNEANWTINKAGKIELNYSVDLLSIEFKHADSPAIFTLVADGASDLACYDLASLEFADKKEAGLAPLMRVNAKLQLEIRDGMVIPVVTMLHVDGYNDRLSVHQENFTNNHDERNLAFHKLMALIDEGVAELNDDPIIKNKLLQIKRLAEQANFGNDMTAIKVASQLIERTICYFYKHFYNIASDRVTMAEAFKEDEDIANKFRKTFGAGLQNYVTREDISAKLKKYGVSLGDAINEDIYNRTQIKSKFFEIYTQLQRIIHHFQPVSSFQYSIPESGIIDAEFFKKWQQQTGAAQPFATKNVTDDFRSRCNIRHHCFNEKSNENEILQAIKDMVEENKKITDEDRATLFEWIKVNRHSNSDALARQLVANHEIKIKAGPNQRVIPDNLRHTIKINRNSAEWDVDLDGNITLSCVYYIASIEGQRLNTFGFKNMQTNYLKFGSVDVSSTNRPPIVRIDIKTAMTVKDGKVTPVIKFLKIDSYTHDVTPMRFEQDVQSLRRIPRQ